MKKTLFKVSVAALALALLTISAVPGTASKSKKQTVSVEGTWQLVSYKYGSAQSGFTDCPEGSTRIKEINKTHFIWVHYGTTSGIITKSGGGRYTLVGNTYTEFIEFGLGMDQYLKTSPQYTVKIEGDILFLSGFLTLDYKIEEIWKRVK
jgi:hypothetical protein